MIKSLHDIFLAQHSAFTPLDNARLRWVEYMNYYSYKSRYSMSSYVDNINTTIYWLSLVYPSDFLRGISKENKKSLKDLAE